MQPDFWLPLILYRMQNPLKELVQPFVQYMTIFYFLIKLGSIVR
jgi:hypothetical protein